MGCRRTRRAWRCSWRSRRAASTRRTPPTAPWKPRWPTSRPGSIASSQFRRPGNSVPLLGVSPDGRLLAAPTATGDVQLIELASGRRVRTLASSSRGALNVVSFAPDARSVIGGSGDGVVRIWDVRTGKRRGLPLRAGDGTAWGVFDPADATQVLTVNADEIVRWDVSTPERPVRVGPTLVLPPEPTGFVGVRTSGDGRLVAAGGLSNARTFVWDADSGSLLAELSGVPGPFTPDGSAIALGASRPRRVRRRRDGCGAGTGDRRLHERRRDRSESGRPTRRRRRHRRLPRPGLRSPERRADRAAADVLHRYRRGRFDSSTTSGCWSRARGKRSCGATPMPPRRWRPSSAATPAGPWRGSRRTAPRSSPPAAGTASCFAGAPAMAVRSARLLDDPAALRGIRALRAKFRLQQRRRHRRSGSGRRHRGLLGPHRGPAAHVPAHRSGWGADPSGLESDRAGAGDRGAGSLGRALGRQRPAPAHREGPRAGGRCTRARLELLDVQPRRTDHRRGQQWDSAGRRSRSSMRPTAACCARSTGRTTSATWPSVPTPQTLAVGGGLGAATDRRREWRDHRHPRDGRHELDRVRQRREVARHRGLADRGASGS